MPVPPEALRGAGPCGGAAGPVAVSRLWRDGGAEEAAGRGYPHSGCGARRPHPAGYPMGVAGCRRGPASEGWFRGRRNLSPNFRKETLARLGQDTAKSHLGRMADVCEMKSMADGFAERLGLQWLHPHDHPFSGQMSMRGVQGDLQRCAG